MMACLACIMKKVRERLKEINMRLQCRGMEQMLNACGMSRISSAVHTLSHLSNIDTSSLHFEMLSNIGSVPPEGYP